MSKKKPRVLIGCIGLGGHEMGAIYVTQILRDAGMEVVYLGLGQLPETIVSTAIQEDIDIIGISCMSAVHSELIPEVMELLKRKGISHIPVIAGGIIDRDAENVLKKIGVREVFGPGTPGSKIINFINQLAVTISA